MTKLSPEVEAVINELYVKFIDGWVHVTDSLSRNAIRAAIGEAYQRGGKASMSAPPPDPLNHPWGPAEIEAIDCYHDALTVQVGRWLEESQNPLLVLTVLTIATAQMAAQAGVAPESLHGHLDHAFRTTLRVPSGEGNPS
jgi:hypothetical protein